MSDIFISYARPDRPVAEALAHALEARGLSVWWDRDIPLGKKFGEVIDAELHSARFVVVLWSENSVSSNWVKDEAGAAAASGRLIPILIQAVAVPLGFRQFQAADLSKWDRTSAHPDLAEFMNDLESVVRTGDTGRLRSPHQTEDKPHSVERVARSADSPTATRAVVVVSIVVAIAAIFGLAWMWYHVPAASVVVDKPKPAPVDPVAVNLAADGAELLERSSYSGAFLKFDAAVKQDGSYAPAYYYRGICHIALGEREEAAKDLSEAIRLYSNDERAKQRAAEKLADLQRPQTTEPPPTGGDPVRGAALRQTVEAMFGPDRDSRIDATTKLITEASGDADAVRGALDYARAHTDNKAGVINTLVYFESVRPELLLPHERELGSFFEAVKANGDQTRQHITAVLDRMKA